jgi:hypothetical protein
MTNRHPPPPLPTRDDPRNEVARLDRVASLFTVPQPPAHLPPLTFRELERWRDYYVGRHPTDWQRHDLIALHDLIKLESRYHHICDTFDLSSKYVEMPNSGRTYAHPAFANMVRLGDMIARRRALLGFTYNVSRDALERFGRGELEAETEQRAIVQQSQEDDDLLAAPQPGEDNGTQAR